MKRFGFLAIFGALLFILGPSSVFGEAVFYKDGRVVYGDLIRENTREVVLRPEAGGAVLKIPRSQVLRIHFKPGKFQLKYIRKSDGTTLAGFIVAEKAGEIVVRKELNNPAEIILPRSNIESISAKKIKTTLPYSFVYNGKAESVTIEGDFNGWREEALDYKDGRWQIKTDINILKKNRYEYRYRVNDVSGKKQFIKFKVQDGRLLEDIDLYRITVGVRSGAGFYLAGNADKFETRQPAVTALARLNLPFLWQPLLFQTELNYFRHNDKDGFNTVTENFDLETDNFFVTGYFGYSYEMGRFSVQPKFGPGIALQSTDVSGQDEVISNSIFFLGYGVEFGYRLVDGWRIILDAKSISQFEDGDLTNLLLFELGLNYRLPL